MVHSADSTSAVAAMTAPYRLQPRSWHTRCAFCHGKGSLRLHYSNARGERFAASIGVDCPHCDKRGSTAFGTPPHTDLVLVSIDTGNGLCSAGEVPRYKSVAYAQACQAATNARAWRIEELDPGGMVVTEWP